MSSGFELIQGGFRGGFYVELDGIENLKCFTVPDRSDDLDQ